MIVKRRDPKLFEGHTVVSEPWKRFAWNLKHLADFESTNPYLKTESGFLHGAPNRTALEDLGHSIKNLFQSDKSKPKGAKK